MSYVKSNIRFVLSVYENLLLAEKMKKLGLCQKNLGTSKLNDYQGLGSWIKKLPNQGYGWYSLFHLQRVGSCHHYYCAFVIIYCM